MLSLIGTFCFSLSFIFIICNSVRNSSLCLLIHSIIYVIDSWICILFCDKIQYCHYLFCWSNCSSFGYQKFLQICSCVPSRSHNLFFFFHKYFFIFLHLKMFQAHLVYFLAPVLGSTVSPRNPDCFYWKMVLMTKIWPRYVHCYWNVTALALISADRARKYMYAQ